MPKRPFTKMIRTYFCNDDDKTIFIENKLTKFKGPFKSFGYWGLKLLPGIRVIAEGLDLRPRPEP